MSCDIIELLKNNNDYKLIGVTGRAGTGKTTFCKSIKSNLYNDQQDCVYSADYKFIGDSRYRRELLESKRTRSIEDYIDAQNQYNWWDWNLIYNDLYNFKKFKSSININNPYNRDSGEHENIISLSTEKIIYEGALLGPSNILSLLDVIIFMVPPKDDLRFNRLLEKDKNRRSFEEICARFLSTNFSEDVYYELLFKNFKDKIICIDGSYNIINFNFKRENKYISFPLGE